MQFIYSLAFLFGADNWKIDPTPIELTGSLEKFDKAKTTILDLGCGDGHDCITLAKQGWHVTGVDFVPLAIRKAKTAAQKAGVADQAAFYVGDVCSLNQLNLPAFDFAYDIGCFHLLKPAQRGAYIAGLTSVVKKEGSFLLKAFSPRQKGKEIVGFDSEAIEKSFSPHFEVERTSNHSYWRFPANWYWMRRL